MPDVVPPPMGESEPKTAPPRPNGPRPNDWNAVPQGSADWNSSPTVSGANCACGGDCGCGGCSNGGCSCGEDCDCPPMWHWMAGVEATYLDPRFHQIENFIFPIDFAAADPGWAAAPRIWLGAENCKGWGARVRYWQLCADRARFGLLDPTFGLIEDVGQNLKVYDIDAELTMRVDIGCWTFLGSFGGRYGSLERLTQ